MTKIAKKDRPNGYIIYRGPSMIDGKPIVVVATGFRNTSKNTKTGTMIQTWIMREDIHPQEAIHTGDDSSVCGDCKHRGIIVNGKNKGRTCYVTLYQAPANVWKSIRRGIYPSVAPNYLANGLFKNRFVRIGSYGDPAAVPVYIWKSILKHADGNTGYTHHWKTAPLEFKNFLMASTDTIDDYFEAKALGYRTFRVRGDSEPLLKNEIACPAAKEMGHKTTCSACKGCGGIGSKANVNFAIMDHGPIARLVRDRVEKKAAKKAA